MAFRQSFDAQTRELTAISTRIFAISSASQLNSRISRDPRAIDDIENSNTIDGDPNTAPYQPVQRTSKAKGRNTSGINLRLSNMFDHTIFAHGIRNYSKPSVMEIFLRSVNCYIAEEHLYGIEILLAKESWDMLPAVAAIMAPQSLNT